MTRRPAAPEPPGHTPRASHRAARPATPEHPARAHTPLHRIAAAGAAAILILATASAAPAPGHGLPGDTVLPRQTQPAARRNWMARQSALCLVAIADASARYGLPSSLLPAIARVETGRPLPVTGDRQPWPWAVNADGESLFFDTRAQAVAETTKRLASGAHFVDIGCMQVDLREHASAFPTLADAFNPSLNADYAARLLVSLRSGRGGIERGWALASGLYHSGTPGKMEPYAAAVAHMQRTQRNTLAE